MNSSADFLGSLEQPLRGAHDDARPWSWAEPRKPSGEQAWSTEELVREGGVSDLAECQFYGLCARETPRSLVK